MTTTRPLSALLAVIAAAVAIDAVGVGAPGLVLAALPFVLALALLRRAPRTAAVIAALGSLLVAATATAYAVRDPGLQTAVDAVYVYVAGPLAFVAIGYAVRAFRAPRPVQG